MNALTIIYWTRVLLGIVAALLCTLFSELVGGISILNGISIALLVYIITYYVYKSQFLTKVEKRSKLFSTGVGAYFFAWIVTFALLFTLVGPTLTLSGPVRGAPFRTGDIITVDAKVASPLGVSFSGASLTAIAISRVDPAKNSTISLAEEAGSLGTYSGSFNTSSFEPVGEWIIRVQAVLDGRYREASVTVSIQSSS